ncbi:MAG TPA: NADH-quinone oxidoreductase subunit J [Burkholderiales bacterium]|jgi:NADH-quinone oxidoreductase subunit J
MLFSTLLFYVFSAVLVFAALGVVTSRNPVHAALWLVLSFFNAAAIWVLLKAEFLAIVLVLVYVGAVMVLFLFVVMMMDINLDKLRENFWKNSKFGFLVGGAMLAEMAFVLLSPVFDGNVPASAPVNQPGYVNVKELGHLIYTDYLFPFEVAAIVLLVAIVAALALTLRGRKNAKGQDPSKQVLVKSGDRLRVIKMPAVARETPAAAAGGTGAAPAAKEAGK